MLRNIRFLDYWDEIRVADLRIVRTLAVVLVGDMPVEREIACWTGQEWEILSSKESKRILEVMGVIPSVASGGVYYSRRVAFAYYGKGAGRTSAKVSTAFSVYDNRPMEFVHFVSIDTYVLMGKRRDRSKSSADYQFLGLGFPDPMPSPPSPPQP